MVTVSCLVVVFTVCFAVEFGGFLVQWTLVVIACFVAVVGVFTLYAGWLGCCCGLVFDAACCGIVCFP